MVELPPTGLPIEAFLPEIAARLSERGVLVLAADPGAGKTSLVPPSLLDSIAGRILVLEPRRVAAVTAAERMAELLGSVPGALVGYAVRSQSRVSAGTRILVATEGVFVRMLQEDPGLTGVGLVIFDEFHERSLQADLGLALSLEARTLRPELKLLVMSATLDTERIAARLEAPVLEVPGRVFPVDTSYVPVAEGPGFEERLAGLAARLSAELGGCDGDGGSDRDGDRDGDSARARDGDSARARDLLVFLPGAAEIGRCEKALNGCGAEILALHGSLSLEAQRRVIAPRQKSGRRIVLATSLAETSLTVPRIGAVLDSGLARLSRFHAQTGLNRLVTERLAADRAEQRRGRAGRLGPGRCVRAWSAAEVLPRHSEPEILRSELSGLVLESLLWGAQNRGDLPWLDVPPEGAWEEGFSLLGKLGALKPGGGLSDIGQRITTLGTEPRLAVLVLSGIGSGRGWEACLLAALLSEREVIGREEWGSDIDLALESLVIGTSGFERTRAEARRLARMSGIENRDGGRGDRPGSMGHKRKEDDMDSEDRALWPNSGGAGRLLAAAFPDRIARRQERHEAVNRSASTSFQLASGRQVVVKGALAQSRWIVAVDADAGTELGRVYAGATLGDDDALEVSAGSSHVELEWTGLSYRAKKVAMAGAIRLSETAIGLLPRGEVAEALVRRIEAEGLAILPWDEDGAGEFLARLRWWAAAKASIVGGNAGDWPGGMPANQAASGGIQPALPPLDDGCLLDSLRSWLAPFVGPGPGTVLDGENLRRAVESLVPHAFRHEFDREAPEKLRLPSGLTRPIRYARGGRPTVESKVQDFYGLDVQLRLQGESVVFILLSPAGRPIQVTSDLPGFWRGSWLDLRKEMRGRYPKHAWPENPASAGAIGLSHDPSKNGRNPR